jgi:hypothetical protein
MALVLLALRGLATLELAPLAPAVRVALLVRRQNPLALLDALAAPAGRIAWTVHQALVFLWHAAVRFPPAQGVEHAAKHPEPLDAQGGFNPLRLV